MKFQLVNKKNIRKFLKTRKDNKWYFRFPWLKGKKTLIVELDGLIRYWRNDPKKPKEKKFAFGLIRYKVVADAALAAYRKRLKKDRRNEKA